MLGKTHQLIGFTSVYTLAIITGVSGLNIQTFIACIILISIGSLTPDLDDDSNKLYALIPIGHRFFSKLGGGVFGKHRSISHSLIGIALFGYLSNFLIFKIPEENGFVLHYLWYSFFISMLAHIAADAMTRDGVPLLWPLKFKFGFPPFKGLRMKTGGFVELFLVRTAIAVFLFGITLLYWDVVRLFFSRV